MSGLSEMARQHSEKTACLVYPAGRRLTYAELDRNANRVSQFLAARGLSQGDGIAILLDNDPTYFELVYGARQLGLYYTPVSTHLKVDEALYIVEDCGAKIFFVDVRLADVIEALVGVDERRCDIVVVNGGRDDCLSYDAEIARFDRYIPVSEGPVGKDFFYSSGTTGRPKGIKQPLFTDMRQNKASGDWVRDNFRFDESSIRKARSRRSRRAFFPAPSRMRAARMARISSSIRSAVLTRSRRCALLTQRPLSRRRLRRGHSVRSPQSSPAQIIEHRGRRMGIVRPQRPVAAERQGKALLALYRQGKLKPVISGRFAWENAPVAIAQVEERTSVGKLVVLLN